MLSALVKHCLELLASCSNYSGLHSKIILPAYSETSSTERYFGICSQERHCVCLYRGRFEKR